MVRDSNDALKENEGLKFQRPIKKYLSTHSLNTICLQRYEVSETNKGHLLLSIDFTRWGPLALWHPTMQALQVTSDLIFSSQTSYIPTFQWSPNLTGISHPLCFEQLTSKNKYPKKIKLLNDYWIILVRISTTVSFWEVQWNDSCIL